jgi:hypothetical protein
LFESLEEICWRFDNKFIEDVSHIIGIPSTDIKRKVLGVRGSQKILLCDSTPWWQENACPSMVLENGGMWRRCNKLCTPDGFCKKHGGGKHGLLYDNPYFEKFPKRHPFKYNGEIVWVAEDKSVLTQSGEILKNVEINIHNGVASESISFWSSKTNTEHKTIQETETTEKETETEI